MKPLIVTTILLLLFAAQSVAQDNNDGLLITEARVAIEKYQDYSSGIRALRKVSSEGQQNPIFSFYMAKSYDGLKDNTKALYYYQQYASRTSLTPELMEKIADLKYKVGNQDEAISNLETRKNILLNLRKNWGGIHQITGYDFGCFNGSLVNISQTNNRINLYLIKGDHIMVIGKEPIPFKVEYYCSFDLPEDTDPFIQGDIAESNTVVENVVCKVIVSQATFNVSEVITGNILIRLVVNLNLTSRYEKVIKKTISLSGIPQIDIEREKKGKISKVFVTSEGRCGGAEFRVDIPFPNNYPYAK